MRFSVGLILISSLCATAPVMAEKDPQTCVDSSRVRNWIVVNDETLLLDAGRRKYRVTLRQSCFNLSTSPTLQFKADPISGRVCGSSLDAIRVQGEQCQISSIEEIDKQVFNDAQNKKKLSLKLKKT
jgi:hypothetical protein